MQRNIKKFNQIGTLALVVFAIAGLALARPVAAQTDQEQVAVSERLVRDYAATGKLTARQMRIVWIYLTMGKLSYAPDDDEEAKNKISAEEEPILRNLAKHFEAFKLYDYQNVKASPPPIKPGDLLIYSLKWEPDGGFVVWRTYQSKTASGDATVFLENDKKIEVEKSWKLSVAPDEDAVRSARPGLMWLRPKTTLAKALDDIFKNAAPSQKSAADWAREGNDALQKKAWTDAEAAYRQAVNLAPNEASYHDGLALSLQNQKKFKDAETAAREAARLDPNNADYRFDIGAAIYGQGNYSGAIEHYKEVLRLDDKYTFAYLDLAASYYNLNKLDEARIYAQKAIDLGYKDYWVYERLGLKP